MTLRNDGKFEENMTYSSKYDMQNLVNFPLTTQKSENFTLMSFLCPKYMKFELKSADLSFMTLNCHTKF